MSMRIPDHLRPFVGEQDYSSRYTPRDHAVWRYCMRALAAQLRDTAHPVYFEGLAKTGIGVEHIPSIDEMNACLERLGWQAVVVDGFIPPQVFMEFQAHRILPIALDMRSIDHVLYTPAPDILHESAGHAPIIADEEYAEYLQRFGEVGLKAMYSARDVDQYEAIRSLSMLKEDPATTPAQLAAAERHLEVCTTALTEPSELALLGRLHWWTVEYGLVGTPEDYRLFGAGLLSSLGESESCLAPSIVKLPLTADAVCKPYDITCEQPQLFVTRSCRHLTQVLEEFSETMCYRRGGSESMFLAIDSEIVATAELSSGVQVSGQFSTCLQNALGREFWIASTGLSQLAWGGEELPGQGIDAHTAGLGVPLGRLCNLMVPLEDASEYELQAVGIQRDSRVSLQFLSGLCVEGYLESILKREHRNVLFSFRDCIVRDPRGRVLVSSGADLYHMAVGERVISVYPGAADRGRFDTNPRPSPRQTVHSVTVADAAEMALYGEVRHLRETGSVSTKRLSELLQRALAAAPGAWLLYLELLELADDSSLRARLRQQLGELAMQTPGNRPLIERGLRLLDNRSLAA